MKTKLLCLLLLSFFASASWVSAQKSHKKITISGYVTDSLHNPVPGVLIMIDHKFANCSTNEKGWYKVKVKPEASVISAFLLVNKIKIDTLVNGKNQVNFMLPMNLPALNTGRYNPQSEEGVNIGYGSSKAKDISTQAKKIDAQKSRYAGYQTIYELIAAQVPGAIVKGTLIRIDGINSVNSKEPLFIVDGTMVGSIGHILPQEVKSITVLKGAAAAIYGSQGGNGVILMDLIRHDQKK